MLARTALTPVEVAAQRRGSAALDGGHSLAAAGIETTGKAVTDGGTGVAEDLRHTGALRMHLASVAKQGELGERVVQLVEHLARRAGVAARGVGVAVSEHVADHLDVGSPLMPVGCGRVASISYTRQASYLRLPLASLRRRSQHHSGLARTRVDLNHRHLRGSRTQSEGRGDEIHLPRRCQETSRDGKQKAACLNS